MVVFRRHLFACRMVFGINEHDIFTVIDNVSFLPVRKRKKWVRTCLNGPEFVAATGKPDQKSLMGSDKRRISRETQVFKV